MPRFDAEGKENTYFTLPPFEMKQENDVYLPINIYKDVTWTPLDKPCEIDSCAQPAYQHCGF